MSAEMFFAAGLSVDAECQSTFWKDVKDFKWHRATKSPNFDLIEDGSNEAFFESKDPTNVEVKGRDGNIKKGEETTPLNDEDDSRNADEDESAGEDDSDSEEEL